MFSPKFQNVLQIAVSLLQLGPAGRKGVGLASLIYLPAPPPPISFLAYSSDPCEVQEREGTEERGRTL